MPRHLLHPRPSADRVFSHLSVTSVTQCHVAIEWPEGGFREDYARLGELREAMPALPAVTMATRSHSPKCNKMCQQLTATAITLRF